MIRTILILSVLVLAGCGEKSNQQTADTTKPGMHGDSGSDTSCTTSGGQATADTDPCRR